MSKRSGHKKSNSDALEPLEISNEDWFKYWVLESKIRLHLGVPGSVLVALFLGMVVVALLLHGRALLSLAAAAFLDLAGLAGALVHVVVVEGLLVPLVPLLVRRRAGQEGLLLLVRKGLPRRR